MTTTTSNTQYTASKIDLPTLVEKLKANESRKQDFVVPAKSVSFEDGKLVIHGIVGTDLNLNQLLGGLGIARSNAERISATFDPLPHFHAQTSDKLSIPKQYYDRMLRGNVKLLDANVNAWLPEAKENYLIRTFIDKDNQNGIARALLSDRFNIIDNYDIMLACLAAIKDAGMKDQVVCKDADITDTKLFMRFVNPHVEVQAPELLKSYNIRTGKGYDGRPTIISGFVVSNSEVGGGAYNISPRAVIGMCDNGMIRRDDAYNKVHLGAQLESSKSVVWSEETRRRNMALIMSQCQDAIRVFLSPNYLEKWIAELTAAGTQELQFPQHVIANTAKLLSLTQEEEDGILSSFMKGGQTTGFGVAQAITHFAQEVTPERQFDLESAVDTVLANIKLIDKKPEEKKKANRRKGTVVELN